MPIKFGALKVRCWGTYAQSLYPGAVVITCGSPHGNLSCVHLQTPGNYVKSSLVLGRGQGGLGWSSKSRRPMPSAVANEDRPDSRCIFMVTGPEFRSLKVYIVV